MMNREAIATAISLISKRSPNNKDHFYFNYRGTILQKGSELVKVRTLLLY